SNIDHEATESLYSDIVYPVMPLGWKVIALKDTNGKRYVVSSHFFGEENADIQLSFSEGAPVFEATTSISGVVSTVNSDVVAMNTRLDEVHSMVKAAVGSELSAKQSALNKQTFYLRNNSDSSTTVDVSMWNGTSYQMKTITLD